MRKSDHVRSRQVITPRHGSSGLRALLYGLALSAAFVSFGSTANATNYNEATATDGDLSNFPNAPTDLHALTFGDNYIVGSSVPSGTPIPGGHGALTNQDNDFFTFTVPAGDVLAGFDLEKDIIVDGDRFFLGLYPGGTSPVDPSSPTPDGLLGYTLPGVPQIGTNLLLALAESDEPNFPPLSQHFTGSLGSGQYTVWLVDGDSPVSYDLDLVVTAAPEPGAWALMLAGIGLTGAMLRQRRSRPTPAIVS